MSTKENNCGNLLKELQELAEIAATIAASSVGCHREYISSFLLPRPFFESEDFETLEVGWGICRTTERGELFRFDLYKDSFAVGAIDVRDILRVFMTPLIEGFGGIIEDTPEGLVVLGGNDGSVENGHSDSFTDVGV
jgi:hypothetical protein